jgi:hypothetical protein
MDYDLPGEGVGVPAPFAPSCDTPGSSEPNQQRPTMLHQDQVTSMATQWWRSPTGFWNGWPADDLSIPAATKDPYVRRVNDENA